MRRRTVPRAVQGPAILLAFFGLLAAGTAAAGTGIQFEDVTDAAGITQVGRSWGSAWGDFDGDGLVDLWLVNHQDPPCLYRNQGDGSFVDIAAQVIAPEFLLPYDQHGAAWADLDNDGDADLCQLADEGDTGPVPSLLFVNKGGLLVEQAAEFGLDYPLGRGRTPLWLDWDRDGRLDVLHPTARRGDGTDKPTALFHQTPAGFADVADVVGLVPNDIETHHFALLADLSGDGVPELLTHAARFPECVYDMTVVPFAETKTALGLPTTCCVRDAVVADLDGDLDNDLFLVRGEAEQGFVQVDSATVEAHLQGTGTESGIALQTAGEITLDVYPVFAWTSQQVFIGSGGVHPPGLTFTVSPTDTSTWGIFPHVPGADPGLYVGWDDVSQTWQILRSDKMTNLMLASDAAISGIAALGWNPDDPPRQDRLLLDVGASFADSTTSAGFLVPSSGTSVVAGDFDNDRDLDLYIVSTGPVTNRPNLLYRNRGGGAFDLVPDAGGAAGTDLGRGDAVTAADYDGDGFLDLLVTNGLSKAPFDQDGPTQLFRNLGNGNHWLEIDLEGTRSSRDGVGAQVLVTAGGTVQLREQAGGMHYRGQSHPRVHFGLGSSPTVERLSVRWPSGITQELFDIPADQILRVIEPSGTGAPEPEGRADTRLSGCLPSPFHERTTIAFTLSRSQPVDLAVHDAAGRRVRHLVRGEFRPAGTHEMVWDGRDEAGEPVASGVYFLRLSAGSVLDTGKVVLLRRFSPR